MLHRQPCSLFFRIHTHAAEFHYIKDFASFCQSRLFIKYRTFVVQFHQNGNDDHKRRCHNNSKQRSYNIKCPFEELLLGCQSAMAEQKQRGIKQVNIFRTHDHNIRYLRNAVAADIFFKAIFEQDISLGCRNISKYHCMILIDPPFDRIHPFADMDLLADVVFILTAGNLLDQILRAVISIYQQHLSRRIDFCIDPPHKYDPGYDDHQIDSCHFQNRLYEFRKLPASDQCQLQIRDRIYTEHGKNLGIQYFKNPQISYFEATVNTVEEVQHQSILCNDYIVSAFPESFSDCSGKCIILKPYISEHACLECQNKCRCQKHDQSFITFSVFHILILFI